MCSPIQTFCLASCVRQGVVRGETDRWRMRPELNMTFLRQDPWSGLERVRRRLWATVQPSAMPNSEFGRYRVTHQIGRCSSE